MSLVLNANSEKPPKCERKCQEHGKLHASLRKLGFPMVLLGGRGG